jgi:hypothetical protein
VSTPTLLAGSLLCRRLLSLNPGNHPLLVGEMPQSEKMSKTVLLKMAQEAQEKFLSCVGTGTKSQRGTNTAAVLMARKLLMRITHIQKEGSWG